MPFVYACAQWDGCWEKYGATRRYLTKDEARRPPYLLSFPGLRLRPHVSELGNNRVDQSSRSSASMPTAELDEAYRFLIQSRPTPSTPSQLCRRSPCRPEGGWMSSLLRLES